MIIRTAQHDCKIELREANLKVTPTRLAVLRILEGSDKPLDVATIRSEVKKAGIKADPATVFRMMNSFSDRGIIREINFQESKLRYEYAAKEDHHHLVCENCGSIEDISDCNIKALEEDIQKKKGFHVKNHALEFFGICKGCRT